MAHERPASTPPRGTAVALAAWALAALLVPLLPQAHAAAFDAAGFSLPQGVASASAAWDPHPILPAFTDPAVDAQVCRIDFGTSGDVSDDGFYLGMDGDDTVEALDVRLVVQSGNAGHDEGSLVLASETAEAGQTGRCEPYAVAYYDDDSDAKYSDGDPVLIGYNDDGSALVKPTDNHNTWIRITASSGFAPGSLLYSSDTDYETHGAGATLPGAEWAFVDMDEDGAFTTGDRGYVTSAAAQTGTGLFLQSVRVHPASEVTYGTAVDLGDADTAAIRCETGCAYLFGRDDYNSDVIRVDPDAKTATRMRYIIPYSHGVAAARHGTHIYLFGGQQSDDTDAIYRFDPGTGEFTAMNGRLPSKRYAAAAASDGVGFIYVFGGRTSSSSSPLEDILRYDVGEDTVTTLSAVIPGGSADTTAAWVSTQAGARIILPGGRESGKDATDRILRFVPADETISVAAAMLPAPVKLAGVTASGTYAYVLGGLDKNGSPSDLVYRFDVGAGSAGTMQDRLPVAVWGPAATGGSTIFALGGYSSSSGRTSTAHLYTPTGLAAGGGGSGGPVTTTTSMTTSPATATTESPTQAATTMTTATTTSPLSETTGSTSPTSDSDNSSGGEAASGQGRGPGIIPPAGAAAATWVLILGGMAIVLPATLRQVQRVVGRRGPGARSSLPLASALFARRRPAPLSVHDLAVEGPRGAMVRGVTFEAPPGRLVAFIGSTAGVRGALLRGLAGRAAHTGRREVGGHALDGPDARRVGHVAWHSQAQDAETARSHVERAGVQSGLPAAEARERSEQLMESLGLPPRTGRRLASLDRWRVEVAAALAADPPVVVVDETPAQVDYSVRASAWVSLRDLVDGQGVTVVTAAATPDAARHADLVGVLHEGRLVATGSPKALLHALSESGRCVDVEFERFDANDRRRLAALVPELARQGLASNLRMGPLSARFYAPDPATAALKLPAVLQRSGLLPRASSIEEVGLDDVVALAGAATKRPRATHT